MAKNTTLSKELKGLGNDLAKALKQMVKSEEFKHLESEVVTGLKSISKTLVDSAKTANKSKAAGRVKRRLKSVVRAGSKQGRAEAKRAQAAAAKGIKKIRKSIKHLP